MTVNDIDFFHQATIRICGSLDVNIFLPNCFEYLKAFMPINGIIMNIYDPQTGTMRNVALVSDIGGQMQDAPIPLNPQAKAYIENREFGKTEIVNHQGQNPVAEIMYRYLGLYRISVLTLQLQLETELIGDVTIFAREFNRYMPEHARLLTLLHDPFCVAMSNTLKHQEVIQLKEMLADDNRYLNRELLHLSGDEIIGGDHGLKNVMEMVQQVAPLNSHVLLMGETGVGKEVIANAVHYTSPRSDAPFIKVNCGAIPEGLVDSELFGHEKGAFTGAISRKRGRFERANDGSIFLDEIGELPPQAQVRLLRVIQSKEIERVGGDKPLSVDVRIIAATNRDLEDMVREGKFREDLWFRLNVFPITIPPLRHRNADIPALVNYFLERKSKEMNMQYHPVLAPGTIQRLRSYHWPGNVRELENAVERALIRGRTAPAGKPLRFEDLPASSSSKIEPQPSQPSAEHPVLSLNLDKAIKNHIQTVLEIAGGRVEGEDGAAVLMGVNPSTLRNRMKKLGIAYGRGEKTRKGFGSD